MLTRKEKAALYLKYSDLSFDLAKLSFGTMVLGSFFTEFEKGIYSLIIGSFLFSFFSYVGHLFFCKSNKIKRK